MTPTAPACPLCFAQGVVLERTLSRAAIVAEWARWPGIDISDEMPAVPDISQWRCGTCGLVFYPGEASGSGRLYEALQRFDWYYLAQKWEYDEALLDIPPGARLCEPGCGRGDFLARAIAARGVTALGLELNAQAAAAAQARGLSVRVQALEEVAVEQAGAFDVVCSFQVLEHVAAPGTHLRAAHALLKPGGRLVLGLPNTESFLGLEDNPLDRPPHHVSRWSVEVVKRALPLLGFRVVRTAFEPLTAWHTRSFVEANLRTRVAARLPSMLQRFVMNWRVIDVMAGVLLRTGWHRRFRGQTLYVLAERS